MALLYKYNCMKVRPLLSFSVWLVGFANARAAEQFLSGYIMFASTAILSFVGGQLVDEVVNDHFGWAVDWIAFLFVMLNFGVVGVVSIFYQKGTPKFVQNGYLVMVSVILAWEFSMWPEWTTIIFCVMFAVYDLCAVLTPCGPLKYLIGLIQDKQAPLPGLLYEAEVRDGVTHNEQRQQRQQQQARRTKSAARNETSSRTAAQRTSSSHTSQSSHSSSGHRANNVPAVAPMTATVVSAAPMNEPPLAVAVPAHIDTVSVPVLSDRPRNVAESNFTTYDCETMDELISLLSVFYETFSPEDTWKAPQVAEKFFPTQDRLWLLIFHKYMVCSCSMDMPCPVQVRQDRRRRAREEEEEEGAFVVCCHSLLCDGSVF